MDDYRIGIVSEPLLGVLYRIVSDTFVSADITCNAAGSVAVNGLHYTGDQRAVATRHPLRANAIDRLQYGRGWRAGVRMLTATLQPLIRSTCHTPALQTMHLKQLSRLQSQVNKSFPSLSSHLLQF